jgi:hypothetical protein
MTNSMAILDTLRHEGFTPDEDGAIFDLFCGSNPHDRMVRVVMDDTDVVVYLMTGNEVEISRIRLTGTSPIMFHMILRATIDEMRNGSWTVRP